LTTPSAEDMNEWSYICIPPIRLHGVDRDKSISLLDTIISTVEPRFNDIGLSSTSYVASDILWYQSISHCYPQHYVP
jgi:hypothetical protein